MKRFVRQKTVLCLMLVTFIGLGFTPKADAEPMREFIMSCSYGVLAGTLVGAATLAFSDKPGDNLNKVARGASFGLYAGILLGLYVVYGVQNPDESEIREQLGYLPGFHRTPPKLPSFVVAPLISERGLEGGEFRYEVVRF